LLNALITMLANKKFTVYKSSAGSGKTFTLVKEYLALALSDENTPPKSYRHILAITFTNKAASEMKERIISTLQELSEPDYTLISERTKATLQILKEDETLNTPKKLDDTIIRKRAQNVLSAILHHYSDFAIGTIDSFVSRVVRTFAFDLKIPMNFDIELDSEELLSKAIDLLIAQIGNDESITKVLLEFAESKTDDEKSWHIESDLKNFAKKLLNEDGVVHIEKLKELNVDDFFEIKNTIQKEIKQFEAHIKKQGAEALKLINDSGIGIESLASGTKGIGKYFEYLRDIKKDKLIPTNTVTKNIETDKWHVTKASATDKAAIDGIKNNLLKIYNEVQEYIQNHIKEITTFDLINKNIYSLAVLNEIEKLLIEYKTQNNIVHISEFNKMISKIVLNEPTPFIYERLGEKYKNYLIDEFQDTSVLQFQNLLPLIDNSLSENQFTMLVGDGKQAIYRWRGGEVEQFAMLPQVFSHNDNFNVKEREHSLMRNYNPKLLNQNHRSKREIIEFNNSFFRTLSGLLDEKYRVIYESLEQQFNPEKTNGYVQVEFILDEDKQEVRNKNLQRTFEIVSELINDNYQLKDIAVLVRKNTDGNDIANYLSQQGIPVISSDSLLLINSPEVNFIISFLKYLINNDDEIIQAEILEYFTASKKYPPQDFLTVFSQQNGVAFKNILNNFFPKLNIGKLLKMPLYELCEELIMAFNLNQPSNAYIQFFLDEVLNYSTRKNNNLNDFIDHWDKKKQHFSLSIPQGMNAVTIMTIHKSKGLEFPVTILPFVYGSANKLSNEDLWVDIDNVKIPELKSALLPASASMRDTDYVALYDEEKNKSLLDILNVYYVALTRPEERLYILTGKPSKTLDKISNISDLFAYYYNQSGEWKDDKFIYTYGTPAPHSLKHKQEQITSSAISEITQSPLIQGNWRESIKMRAAAPNIWNLDLANSKKNHGVLVHTALAKIKYTDDVAHALESMFLEGLINTEEKEKLTISLGKIVSHPQLQSYFTKEYIIKNEAEIITAEGKAFRPDRVAINNKLAVVIDYKTGEEKNEHKKQLLQYVELLEQLGYSVKERLLVYIEKGKIVAV
jgi:ATP-dependent exoDNAse (exonuclease V) beta subunit